MKPLLSLKLIIWSMLLFMGMSSVCESATVMISYQLSSPLEHLKRVRFLLTDSKYDQQMYPRGDGYVEDASNTSRMVIIHDLHPGEYTIEFLLPNSDGMFYPIEPRKFTVNDSGVTKIDQAIKIRYASIQVEAKTKNHQYPLTNPPTITLMDSQQQVCHRAESGVLTAYRLVPGKYTVVFEEISGFTSPSPMEITIQPGEHMGPLFGFYSPML